jgi:hypothetical protein
MDAEMAAPALAAAHLLDSPMVQTRIFADTSFLAPFFFQFPSPRLVSFISLIAYAQCVRVAFAD